MMGFGDMLYQLGIGYNSPEGLKMGERVMKTITDTAHEMSHELAKEKGVFSNWKLSVFSKKNIKMRNAALTTVAPTGSISMMLDTSSGVEPNFALSYVKQDKDGHTRGLTHWRARGHKRKRRYPWTHPSGWSATFTGRWPLPSVPFTEDF